MINRAEIIIGVISVVAIALALTLVQDSVNLASLSTENSQVATVQPGLVVDNVAVEPATQTQEQQSMEIEDVTIGDGAEVKAGDMVQVHYTGTFQNGQVFDSSKSRGVPFEFTVGAGQVIAGWEQGLLGMKVGGERKLVVPPELAYGERGIGPIPGNTTLLFTIELLAIQ